MTGLILRKLTVTALLAVAVSPAVAGPVYVQQMPSANNGAGMQMDGASPAYTLQLPAGARPVVVTNRPTNRIRYISAHLLDQPAHSGSSTVETLAVEPYANDTPRRLPSVEGGATAVLAQVAESSQFPTVGQGLMNP